MATLGPGVDVLRSASSQPPLFLSPLLSAMVFTDAFLHASCAEGRGRANAALESWPKCSDFFVNVSSMPSCGSRCGLDQCHQYLHLRPHQWNSKETSRKKVTLEDANNPRGRPPEDGATASTLVERWFPLIAFMPTSTGARMKWWRTCLRAQRLTHWQQGLPARLPATARSSSGQLSQHTRHWASHPTRPRFVQRQESAPRRPHTVKDSWRPSTSGLKC